MEVIEKLIPVIGTLLGAVVGLLGGWLAARRTRSEKLWDLRRGAYSVILSEIASTAHIVEHKEAMMDEDSHRYFESEYRKTHDAKIAAHFAKATQRFADDYLVLSDEFIAIFEQMNSDIAEDPNDTWPEEQERFATAIKNARVLLTARARKEVIEHPIPRITWPSWF